MKVIICILLLIIVLLMSTGVAMANFTFETDSNNVIAWQDWPEGYYEPLKFVMNNRLMFGYLDGTFKPWDSVSQWQVITVAARAKNKVLDPLDYEDKPATMGWVQQYFLPGTVYSAGMDEECTRFRFAVMLERYGLKPGPVENPPTMVQEYGAILDKWFDETYVTWSGVKRQSRLVGCGEILCQESIEHDIPIWFALGQCWLESQWFTTGLASKYNCGWGIKASPSKWGELGDPATVGSGFGNYVSVEEAVRAYFRYLDGQTSGSGYLYRDLIDRHEWERIINIYAPPYENDCNEYYRVVRTVQRWCEDRGLRPFDEGRLLW